MTKDDLRRMIVAEFKSAGLEHYLELNESEFHELSTFFEVSHLSMELVLNHSEAKAAVSAIVTKVKSDLQRRGIELEHLVRIKYPLSQMSLANR